MATTPMTLFAGLCADLPPPALAELRTAVQAHYAELVAAQAKDELIAVDLAELLATHLDTLLASAHLFTADARADLVGAARYFISDKDTIPDLKPCTGLDDDVQVFNHVARALGRPDLVITE
ncbi:MAG: hypothetical protein IPJ61_21195 [Tessaracoccus sp.]|uniref:hypothetical protein n=1 Tax=Tessaracoccus sp. TaxID=1971211 RepID=UPI001EB6CCB9|nr:hypothetical protein [Tessaracoccus sp.]MBK7823505.1 hypothetical protein [Tessaracoccus sp.]